MSMSGPTSDLRPDHVRHSASSAGLRRLDRLARGPVERLLDLGLFGAHARLAVLSGVAQLGSACSWPSASPSPASASGASSGVGGSPSGPA